MGRIRNLFRSLLDREMGVLGGEIDRLQAKIADQDLQLATLNERWERLSNRVGMRLARSARRGEGGEPEALREFAELVRRDRGGNGADHADDGYTDFGSLIDRR